MMIHARDTVISTAVACILSATTVPAAADPQFDKPDARDRIRACWQLPTNVGDLPVVDVQVTLTRDKFVSWSGGHVGSGLPMVEVLNAPADPDAAFLAAADAAVRAAANPACQPWEALPDNLWPQWQTVILRFDPRDLQ